LCYNIVVKTYTLLSEQTNEVSKLGKGDEPMDKRVLKQEMLKILQPEQVLADDLDLMYYSYDSSFLTKLERVYPDIVVLPRATEQVQRIVRFAYENNIPVTPRGAGTGETGGGSV